MSRDLTAATQTAAEGMLVRPVVLVHLALDSGAVYVNSSDRNITYNANIYIGIGALGSVSVVQESSGLQASGVKLTMSGIPASHVTMVLDEDYQGRAVTIYQGFLDDTYALIADPILQWTGLIDQMGIIIGETATVNLTAENKLVRWETPNIHRYTDADQQQRFSGDLGLQFVAQTVEREILWGRARARQ